ncbi:hypothetical protein JQ582_33015 [Bradyrhizobium japonicum]|uniref:hypothetical protein n=1 Tax=Bradyrhizobium japonicum TaxID=375 RepID=UPI001BAD1415|nr:hypothetical protein [Bradyrhizobium japonicum]MBR0748763.1 hypothetical protein [Bradyrhizobium japonicum]
MSKAKLAFFFLGVLTLAFAIIVESVTGASLPQYRATAAVPNVPPPGIGIRSLIFFDAVLAYTLWLLAIDFFPGLRAIFARLQGALTLVLSIVGILLALAFVIAAINLITTMLTLLVSPPFGTIAYFAAWGNFDKTPARMVIDLSMFLKILGLCFIAASNPLFLRNKGFVLLFGFSLGLTFVLGLLHALPPSFLVAITDALGAIITGIAALIWMIVLLIGAVFAIIRAIRSVAMV